MGSVESMGGRGSLIPQILEAILQRVAEDSPDEVRRHHGSEVPEHLGW